MNILRYSRIFLGVAITLVIASLVIIVVKGFTLGVEFTGGTLTEFQYNTERPSLTHINTTLGNYDFRAQAQYFSEQNIIVRTRELSEADRGVLLASMTYDNQEPEIVRSTSVGPSLGKELRVKALWSLSLVVLSIILFIAWSFRSVSQPVSSWKYGIIAVVTLLHDVIIPLALFVLLGKEVTSLVIVGLLSILGLSINDTIVVFDRIRENITLHIAQNKNSLYADFSKLVNDALRSSMARSINTSLTLMIVLLVLVLLGPASTKDLSLILLLGTFFGTYSSIFVASPLLVMWKRKESETVLEPVR